MNFIKSKSKSKSKVPKQGYVFTPAFEEKGENCLLIIDPQNSFIDDGTAMNIIGAVKDMERISNFINKNIEYINSIFVTLDTHSRFHIGNANAFENGKEFESIKYKDVNRLVPKQKQATNDIKKYLIEMENKDITHTLWPLHCLMGTYGHNVNDTLNNMLTKWSEENRTEVKYILKGCSALYENFSVFRSTVIDDFNNKNKEQHKFNNDLAEHLSKYKTLYICGEARTHCVADSTIDYILWLEYKKIKQNIIILWDCMSDVPLFENKSKLFKNFCSKYKYVNIMNSDEVIFNKYYALVL